MSRLVLTFAVASLAFAACGGEEVPEAAAPAPAPAVEPAPVTPEAEPETAPPPVDDGQVVTGEPDADEVTPPEVIVD